MTQIHGCTNKYFSPPSQVNVPTPMFSVILSWSNSTVLLKEGMKNTIHPSETVSTYKIREMWKMQISIFLHHHKSMYLPWCFQLFFPDPTPLYCWRKEEHHPATRDCLYTQGTVCLLRGVGWHTAKGEGMKCWVSHKVLFIFLILLAISSPCLCCRWERNTSSWRKSREMWKSK